MSTFTDTVRRADYSERLVEAAEHWLIERFSQDDLEITMPDQVVGEVPESHPMLNAAMTIVVGDAWIQPMPHQSQQGMVADQIASREAPAPAPGSDEQGEVIARFSLTS